MISRKYPPGAVAARLAGSGIPSNQTKEQPLSADLRALLETWRQEAVKHPHSAFHAYNNCADELQAALDAQAGGDAEYRLWDSQWVNVVNHEHAYRDWEMEAAIHCAVTLAEQAMAKNIADGKWPKPRNAAAQAGPVEAQAGVVCVGWEWLDTRDELGWMRLNMSPESTPEPYAHMKYRRIYAGTVEGGGNG